MQLVQTGTFFFYPVNLVEKITQINTVFSNKTGYFYVNFKFATYMCGCWIYQDIFLKHLNGVIILTARVI